MYSFGFNEHGPGLGTVSNAQQWPIAVYFHCMLTMGANGSTIRANVVLSLIRAVVSTREALSAVRGVPNEGLPIDMLIRGQTFGVTAAQNQNTNLR
jgi:hypothetical protein